MRSTPGHPSSWTPPSAHAQLGGRRILKARLPRLRQCAQQRTPRDQRTSDPAALALNHQPTTLGTMAAVAAASAELLIIGWYIFRVLLQVSVPGFWVGEGSDARPLNRQARVATAAFPTRPVLIAAIPVCPNAAGGTARPARPLRPPPCVDPSQCARPGTKSWGAAGANRGRSPKLLATNGVRKSRYTQTGPQEGGGALLFCEKRLYGSHSQNFPP